MLYRFHGRHSNDMTVIAELTIPPDALFLGHIFEDISEIEIELEPVVPLEEGVIPLMWISGSDPASVESRLENHNYCQDVKKIMSTDDRTLFELQWNDDFDGLIQTLLDAHVTMLQATGNTEYWEFHLRFPTHEHLSNFSQMLTEKGVSVTLHHLYNPAPEVNESGLSPEQRDMLILAYRNGYYEVPRRTNLAELAEEQYITDSALSQRLRRATSQLIEQSLLSGEQPTL